MVLLHSDPVELGTAAPDFSDLPATDGASYGLSSFGDRDVLTASDDKTAGVWNLKGERIITLTHQGRVWSAQWSPDGQTIVTASDDKTAGIYTVGVVKMMALAQHYTTGVRDFTEEERRRYGFPPPGQVDVVR